MLRNSMSALRVSRSAVLTSMKNSMLESQFSFQATTISSRAHKIADLYKNNPIRSFTFNAANRFAEIIRTKSTANSGPQTLNSLTAIQDTSIQHILSSNHLINAVTQFARLAIAASKLKPPSPPVSQPQIRIDISELKNSSPNPIQPISPRSPTSPSLSTKRVIELAIAASQRKPPASPTVQPDQNMQRHFAPEQLARLIAATARRPIPSTPAVVSPKSASEIKSPRSILKAANVKPAVHTIPALTPSEIFKGILDFNLLSEKETYEEDGETYIESDEDYSNRVMNLCKALTQQERNELAEIVYVVRGTTIQTKIINPPEKSDAILDRLNIPNENRRKSNIHNERLEEHSFSRLRFNSSMFLFKETTDHAVTNTEMKPVPLKLNLNDRHASSVVKQPSGNRLGRPVLRTLFPRHESDKLSLSNQLSPVMRRL